MTSSFGEILTRLGSDVHLRSIDPKQRRTYLAREVGLDKVNSPLSSAIAAIQAAADGLNDPELEVIGDYGCGVDVFIVGWRDATDDELVAMREAETKREAWLQDHARAVAQHQPPVIREETRSLLTAALRASTTFRSDLEAMRPKRR